MPRIPNKLVGTSLLVGLLKADGEKADGKDPQVSWQAAEIEISIVLYRSCWLCWTCELRLFGGVLMLLAFSIIIPSVPT